jgi:amidase
MRQLALAIAVCSLWPVLAGTAELSDANIVALDAVELRAELAAGRVSAERVTQAFLRRIAALDDAGPTLRAVIEVNPDAEAIARDLDRRRNDGPIGALHGLPVLIKANIDTADRMATSAGSLALVEHHAVVDAVLVARLRAAGAVVLGKTNLSEWANFRSPTSSSGWSSIGGQTRNAYVLDRSPCGSSSGAAVAVAARLAPLAIGTETNGSIVCPAAANGVVGIKPTIGLISGRGIIPLAPSQDTAGPLARTVADAALLLRALANTAAEPAVGRASLRGMRVGVVRNYFGVGTDAVVEASFGVALQLLEGAGVVLVDPANPELTEAASAAEFTLLLAEFRDSVGRYLGSVTEGPSTLDELIEFNATHASEVMPYFGQELLLAARGSDGIRGDAYAAAVTVIGTQRQRLAELFAAQRLDALVAPANARAWRVDWQVGDAIGVSSSSIAAVSGYPSVVVPIQVRGELPLGVALIGKPLDEALLLDIAAVLERARGSFPEPRFLQSTAD